MQFGKFFWNSQVISMFKKQKGGNGAGLTCVLTSQYSDSEEDPKIELFQKLKTMSL